MKEFEGLTRQDFDNISRSPERMRQARKKLKILMNAVADQAPHKIESIVMNRPKFGYVSRIRRRGGGPLREVLWMGFAHRVFENPRNGVQLQFGFSRRGIEFNGIWIEGWPAARQAKVTACRQLLENPRRFRRLLGKLPSDYYLGIWDTETGEQIRSWQVSKVRNNPERLRWFSARTGDIGANVAIEADMPRVNAIKYGRRLPNHILQAFDELLELYSFMIGNPVSQAPPDISKVRPVVLDVEALDERIIRGRIRKSKTGHALIADRAIDPESARRAEEIVYKDERDKLRAAGRRGLAKKVRDVSKFSGYGYDIESFTNKGKVIRIEVKSFKGSKFRTIILTSSEWEAAQGFGKGYAVYVVFRPNTKTPEILPIANFLQHVKRRRFMIQPYTYAATPI